MAHDDPCVARRPATSGHCAPDCRCAKRLGNFGMLGLAGGGDLFRFWAMLQRWWDWPQSNRGVDHQDHREQGPPNRNLAVPPLARPRQPRCYRPLSILRADAKTKKPPQRAALPLIVGTVDDQNFTRAPPITASKSSICSLPLTHEAPPVAQLASAEKCRQLR